MSKKKSMSNSLWPNLAGTLPQRGMVDMLNDAAGDIAAQTNGEIGFYVDAVGVGRTGVVQEIRYNCYLRFLNANNSFTHLLFRVTSPVGSPFPAIAVTPEDEEYPDLKDETALRDAIRQILQRERTKEVVLYMLGTIPRVRAAARPLPP